MSLLLRSCRCCDDKVSFGVVTVTRREHSSEIHVRLQQNPCCDNEYQSYLSNLTKARQCIPPGHVFYLLYILENCTYNTKREADQATILEGAGACAIVCPQIVTRTMIKTITSLLKNVQVFEKLSPAMQWLKKLT